MRLYFFFRQTTDLFNRLPQYPIELQFISASLLWVMAQNWAIFITKHYKDDAFSLAKFEVGT